MTLEPDHSRPYLLVTLISGLFFWSVGAVVFAPRIDQQAVSLFFWISILYGSAVLVGGVYGQSLPPGSIFVRSVLQLTSLAILPAAFLHLSLAFPSRTAFLVRWPRFPVVFYLVAVVLVLWQAAGFLDYLRRPGPDSWAILLPPQTVADGMMVLQVVMGFSVLVRRAGRLEDALQRKQVRWLILGFVVGSAPYVFFRTLPNLFGAPAPFPAYFDRLLELAVPMGFVLAVVRYRFLDIDIILRRGLIYGFLAAGLVGVVVLPVLLLGPAWTDPWPGWWRLVVILCGLVAGILFRPLRQIIGKGVDRAFFKIEREVEASLRRLQAVLDVAADHQDLADRLRNTVAETLHLERCGVLVQDGPAILAAGVDEASEIHNWKIWQSVPEPREVAFLGLPQFMAGTTEPYLALPQELVAEGFVAACPLVTGGQTLGAMLLGPKVTGRLFISADLEFLRGGAELAARRLDQLNLARTVAGERLKRRQMDELSRMKDDFLSRVAHDLRTPVTSVGWSLRNLQDGLAGDLNDKQQEYLSSIRDSVDHLTGLVTDLLEISRLEKTKVEVSCVPLDPDRAVRRATGTVAPLGEVKSVVLETIAGNPLQVLANEDKLTEVLVNLMENAVRYSPSGGIVTVETRPLDGRRVRITVRDQGPGLGGLADPFGRFVQGKPSQEGGQVGYGLGLAIAREYVELMGGEIRGGDHPGGGAEFSLDLPRSAEPNGVQT